MVLAHSQGGRGWFLLLRGWWPVLWGWGAPCQVGNHYKGDRCSHGRVVGGVVWCVWYGFVCLGWLWYGGLVCCGKCVLGVGCWRCGVGIGWLGVRH